MTKGRGRRIRYQCVTCRKSKNGWFGQRYCSKECRNKAYGRTTYFSKIPRGTVGAIQELKVSADLLSKGYEVFRALSHHCSCDLLILTNKKPLRIEVKTGYENPKTHYIYAPKRIVTQADIMAYSLPDRIVYTPDLPSPKG